MSPATLELHSDRARLSKLRTLEASIERALENTAGDWSIQEPLRVALERAQSSRRSLETRTAGLI
jgi:hypothetical protein